VRCCVQGSWLIGPSAPEAPPRRAPRPT